MTSFVQLMMVYELVTNKMKKGRLLPSIQRNCAISTISSLGHQLDERNLMDEYLIRTLNIPEGLIVVRG